MVTDPVCGMSVEVGPGALRLDRDNRTYYFCCRECLRSFAEPEGALRRLRRQLTVAWPLSVAVAVLTWAPTFPRAALVAAALAAVVQGYAGAGFYRGAWDGLRQRLGNMDLLVAVGSSAAFLYSVAVLAWPARLPSGTYFDASSLIVTVILTGNYLEQLTRRRAGSALRRLGEILPTTAVVVDAAGARPVPVAELRPGVSVRIPPGERFPVDGVVRRGSSAVDESLLTGEEATVRRVVGDRVLAGSLNVEGPLDVEARSIGPDTFVAQIGELLQDAELARVPLQQRADRIAAWFAPFVLALAVTAGVLWFVGTGDRASVGVLVFVTVAVTACPCAFGLATPAALLVGTGRAAEEGILFRGGDSVERGATVDTVLFDKTGTLTSGTEQVSRVFAAPPLTEAEVVQIAAALEQGIRHPLAAALSEAAARSGVGPLEATDRRLEPGRGVFGTVAGHAVALVRGDAPDDAGSGLGAARPWVDRIEAAGESWSLLLRDGRPVGAISFRAQLRPGARDAIAELRSLGLRLGLVTGDREVAARPVATTLGLSEVYAGVAPAEKVSLVRRLEAEGRHVAFVGDGLNDAAALAAADLGIALGTGAEVARESGQVLLVRPDLAGVPRALRLARRIVARVRGNFVWALGYNAVLLPVAAGALVPAFGLGVYRLLPIAGAVAMALSSTTVLVRSLSLRREPLGSVRAAPSRSADAREAQGVL